MQTATIALLAASILCASAYVVPSSDLGVGAYCRLPNGRRGACTLVTQCPSALAAVRHGTRRGTHGALPRCGFQGNVEIVCCAVGRGQTRPHTSQTSRRPDTEWVGKPPVGRGSTMQTLVDKRSTSACRYYSTNCPKSVSPYIVGGTVAQRGEFPHMAALGFPPLMEGQNVSWDCGGSLISDRYVMTAAHCTSITKRKPFVVRLGDLDINTDEDGVVPVDLSIEQVHIHPSYSSGTRYHDIALIRLKEPVKFTELICPACLYTGGSGSPAPLGGDSNDLTDRILNDGEEIGPRLNDDSDLQDRRLTVAGWGTVEYSGDRSPILMKANLSAYSIMSCNESWTRATGRSVNSLMPRGLNPSAMICAGDPVGNQDTCQADSGGPLQFLARDSPIYTVVGITSFGEKCGYIPAVYTRVSSYIDWIENIVWPGGPPS